MKSIQTVINATQVGMPMGDQGVKLLSAMDVAIVDSVFAKLRVLFPVGAPKPEAEAVHKSEWQP
jgi:hypothetical protein